MFIIQNCDAKVLQKIRSHKKALGGEIVTQR